MAEERNLGLARARETGDDDSSKADLQRRMEEARDSITNTVSEIKDNVAQQVETVKDALDWREHFKKRPVAWSLGAAGVGFFVGYGLAAAISDDDGGSSRDYASSIPRSYSQQPEALSAAYAPASAKTNGHDEGPGMLERFRETSAYDRLSKEAGALGDRLIEELSTTAQAVVLPALLKKLKGWIGADLSDKTPSMGTNQSDASLGSESAVAQSREF